MLWSFFSNGHGKGPMMEQVPWSSLLLGESSSSLISKNCSVLMMWLFSYKLVWMRGWRVLIVIARSQWNGISRKYLILMSNYFETIVTSVTLYMGLKKFIPLWQQIRTRWHILWWSHWLVSMPFVLTTNGQVVWMSIGQGSGKLSICNQLTHNL